MRAPSSNPSAVPPPATVTTPSSTPSAAQQPSVAVPATRPGCNPSQQAGSPSIAGTGPIGTTSVSVGDGAEILLCHRGVTARQDNQVMTGSPQTPASNPRTPARSEATTRGSQTTGARSSGTIDTGNATDRERSRARHRPHRADQSGRGRNFVGDRNAGHAVGAKPRPVRGREPECIAAQRIGRERLLIYRTNSRIARSRPSSVSGYIRLPMSWRMIRIELV